MAWAEAVGIGEIGLMPSEFWHLTVREFHLKHEAFLRAEDRTRALFLELAFITGHFSEQHTKKLGKLVEALRRYPEKPWLKSE